MPVGPECMIGRVAASSTPRWRITTASLPTPRVISLRTSDRMSSTSSRVKRMQPLGRLAVRAEFEEQLQAGFPDAIRQVVVRRAQDVRIVLDALLFDQLLDPLGDLQIELAFLDVRSGLGALGDFE